MLDNFCIALFSGVHKLTALYNILRHFLHEVRKEKIEVSMCKNVIHISQLTIYIHTRKRKCFKAYLCAQKSPHALNPISQKFSQCCLWNGSYVRLTDDGPLSSFQGRSSSAS